MIIELIVGLLIALAMFILGMTLQTMKKIVKVLVSFICKCLNKVGINLNYRERKLNIDTNVITDYKEITRINRGVLGMHKKRSVNIFALILVLVTSTLIITNLNVLTGNVITNWLSNMLTYIHINISPQDMNTIYTAAIFSVLSFGLTSLLSRWKETADIRKEKKHQKKKEELLKEMTADELIVEAEKRDQEKIKIIKEGDQK